ncbi:hypothetical protein V491_06691 [Pseudogymnoascus sp. VKM F-3775]|nr:hypothetical protein V491_06691 [Pseudogymnoascus sp. VKM F-3775]
MSSFSMRAWWAAWAAAISSAAGLTGGGILKDEFVTTIIYPRSSLVFYNFTKAGKMESPHEHQQNLLLSRIITNVEKLNEAIVLLNKSLQEINIQNMNVELVAQMFKNYQSNVLFHLEATDSLKEPS